MALKRNAKWSVEQNEFLIRTYYKVTALESNMTHYLQRIVHVFKQKYPELGLTERRASTQRKRIILKQLLTLNTINSLREEVARELEIMGQSDPPTSRSHSMAITVKVEVEPVDETNEDETVNVKTEPHDPDENDYTEENTDKPTSKSKSYAIQRKMALISNDVHKIDRRMVFEELDKVLMNTTDVADHILAMEVRNTWGYSCHEYHEDGPTNQKIAACLAQWLAWSSVLIGKDTPLAYNCHVCERGWWHLGPFRDHVNTDHKNEDLYICLDVVDYESFVVAKLKDSKPTSILIEGECSKCGGVAECHIVPPCRRLSPKYVCPHCGLSFMTCSLLSSHLGSCKKYLHHVQKSPTIDNLYTCHLCSAVREKVELIEEHYIYSHGVRSDVPAYVTAKTCGVCYQRVACLRAHPCPVKKPSAFCVFCMKRFSTFSLLKSHENIYVRPTQCAVCKVKLSSQCSLPGHMAQEHSGNFCMVPKCVLCVESTVFRTEGSRNAHIELHHFKSYDRRRHAFSVIVPKTCLTPNNILQLTSSNVNESHKYGMRSCKETPRVDTTPDDNLNQIVVKEVCGNFVDSTDEDSQIADGEYVNTSSVFFPSSTVRIKSEPLDLETALSVEQIKEEVEDSTMEDEEQATEDMDAGYDVIVKEEESFVKDFNDIDHYDRNPDDEISLQYNMIAKRELISDPDTVKYEDVLVTMLGIKREEDSEENSKGDNSEETKDDLLEEMICANSQTLDGSDSDSEIVEYTPLTSYFCDKKDRIDCDSCQNTFSLFKYKMHLQYCTKKVYCTSCDKHYENMSEYCSHFESEHGFEYQQCPICKGCQHKEPFLSHFKRHVVQTFVPVRCLTYTTNGPKLHIEYKCKRCTEKVGVNSVLAHWELHYSLSQCDEVSENAKPSDKAESNEVIVIEESSEEADTEKIIEILLQKPVNTRRGLQHKSYMAAKPACILCKKLCQRHSTYKIHLIEHLLKFARQKWVIHKSLQCPICKLNLLETNKFREHMRGHASLLSYTCTMCKKNFGNASNFAKHKKMHNYNILPCEVCGKKFHQDYQLKKHLEMHVSVGSITCDCCDKLFLDESSHRRHLRLEKLKKNPSGFGCKLCKQKFRTTKALKDHEWAEHTIRRYKADCPMCQERFRKFLDLKNHLKDRHFVRCNKKGWKNLIGTRATLEQVDEVQ